MSLLICFMVTLALQAQIRGNNIEVMVQPDHQDWTYKTSEKDEKHECFATQDFSWAAKWL